MNIAKKLLNKIALYRSKTYYDFIGREQWLEDGEKFFTNGKGEWQTSNGLVNWYTLNAENYWRRICSKGELDWLTYKKKPLRQFKSDRFHILNDEFNIKLFTE